MKISPKIIEAAILNKNMSLESIYKYIDDVALLGIKGICFPSSFADSVELCEFIEDSSYRNKFDIIGVVGYPNGDTSIGAKLAEIADLCGFASILDIVINPIYVQSAMWDCTRAELIEIFLSTNAEIRWIIETPTLADKQITTVTNLILETGGNIKTASGTKGDTKSDHVLLIRDIIKKSGKNIMIKAAGGVKTNTIAESLVFAGADILGCSGPSLIL